MEDLDRNLNRVETLKQKKVAVREERLSPGTHPWLPPAWWGEISTAQRGINAEGREFVSRRGAVVVKSFQRVVYGMVAGPFQRKGQGLEGVATKGS